jgi:hypothetical protein
MSNIDLSQLVTAEDKTTAARHGVRERLKEDRKRRETAGVPVAEGHSVPAGPDDLARMAGVLQALEAGMIAPPVTWKTAQGWRELDIAEFRSLVAAVARHVQAGFAAEKEAAEDPGRP